MDWNNYFSDQINKSKNHPLNKVNDFTGNQTGGFIRPFGNFLREQNIKFNKWLYPEKYKQMVERIKQAKDANEDGKKKNLEQEKIDGQEQEGGYNPYTTFNMRELFKEIYE